MDNTRKWWFALGQEKIDEILGMICIIKLVCAFITAHQISLSETLYVCSLFYTGCGSK